MSQLTPPDPSEAASALRTSTDLGRATRQRAEEQRSLLARTTAGVGVLVAAYLVSSLQLSPRHTVWFAVATAVYGLGLVLLITAMRRQLTVTARGWTRRYTVSLAMTMSLYSISLLVLLHRGDTGLALSLLLGAVVAAPMVVAGVRELRA